MYVTTCILSPRDDDALMVMSFPVAIRADSDELSGFYFAWLLHGTRLINDWQLRLMRGSYEDHVLENMVNHLWIWIG